MALSFSDEFNRTSLNGAGSPGHMTTLPWGDRTQTNLHQSQTWVDASYVTPTGVKPRIDPFSIVADPSDPADGVLTITAQRTPSAYASDIPISQVLTAAHEVSNVTSPLGAAFTGTVITSGADEIWLANIKLAQLAANDFGF